MKSSVWLACLLASLSSSTMAYAVSSSELYSAQSYRYGRFEARLRFAGGDGVVSSFFLWKDGSEVSGTYWNELDFEKLGADCHLETNALFGSPPGNHTQKASLTGNLCEGFHTYAYEWTPEYIAWFVDGSEIRREVGATAVAFAENAPAGMQIRFNVWPGDASFGGNFTPDILPVHQYISWVQYSSYADGEFTFQWREEFDSSTVPTGWLTGSWASPKNRSTHAPANVTMNGGYAVLSLTADDALGFAGTPPPDDGTTPATPASPTPAASTSSSSACSVSGGPSRGGLSGALVLAGSMLLFARRIVRAARRSIVA